MGSVKGRKYLLYAGGEIALVVIGILLALQINKWNQQRLDIQLERSFLQRLKQDLSQDISTLSQLVVEADSVIYSVPEIIDLLYTDKRTLEEVYSLTDVSNAIWVNDFIPQDATYQEMESSGQLRIIRRDTLREAIINIAKSYQLDVEGRGLINDWIIGVIRALDTETKFIKYNEWTRFAFDDHTHMPSLEWNRLNDPSAREFQLVENMIASRLWIVQQKRQRYQGLLKECRQVLQLVSEQLDRTN